MFSIHTLVLEMNNGLSLNKVLIPHRNLRNINLNLKTIDDLFILLDGLVPNIQTMIIHLSQKRILCKINHRNSFYSWFFYCFSWYSSNEYIEMSSIK
jgi:hypothetical protein